MIAKLKNLFSSPAKTSASSPKQSHDAGSYRGSLSSWHTQRIFSPLGEARERELIARRAEDLYQNDSLARSGINDICTNVIGCGLSPQVKIPFEKLSLDKEQAFELQKNMEWEFAIWASSCHAKGILNFELLQYNALRSILRNGECLHLPVFIAPTLVRPYGLTIQDIKPNRLLTPSDLSTNYNIKDGIELSDYGSPLNYYIATPNNLGLAIDYNTLTSSDFSKRPAWLGHRKNVFHLYNYEHEEAVRGVSALATAIKMFRNLSDCLDYELLAQVMSAAFPVFIETEQQDAAGYLSHMQGIDIQKNDEGDFEYIQNIEGGSVLYGKAGQKPHVLKNERPSPNFASFVEIIQRVVAASLDTTYEAVTKDFSKSNYSSIRAAMNESWKVYRWYRSWFAPQYCQPIFEMVIEEAVLRGRLKIDLNSFYTNLKLYCNVNWVGPARGFVDPIKEVQAIIMRLNSNLMTMEDAHAEMGQDFDDSLPTMADEREKLNNLPPLNLISTKASDKNTGGVRILRYEMQKGMDSRVHGNDESGLAQESADM